MEKQQLSVDDDLLPIYYVHSNVGAQTFSWPGQEASASLPSRNCIPPFTENCLPPAPNRTDTTLVDKYDDKAKDGATNLGCTPGTKTDVCFSKKDYSFQTETFSAIHQSPDATSMKTQTSTTTKSSSAQDVFLSSLLQVQMCFMDLQDQIDITETSHKARERKQNGDPPSEPLICGSSTQEPQISRRSIESIDGDLNLEDQDPDEDQESDDAACSELEVADEDQFCDNPLFKNSNLEFSLQPTVHTTRTVTTKTQESSLREKSEMQGSQLLKQNVWHSSDMGTRTAVWHQITWEESLEELKIYEDEWEERAVVFSNTSSSEIPALNSLPSAHECREDSPAEGSEDRSLPDVPIVSPSQGASMKETGLLFSESSYWTKLLIEDEEPEEHDQPTPNLNQPSAPLTWEDPTEDILQEPCQDRNPQVDILQEPCQDRTPQVDILQEPCQDRNPQVDILQELCQDRSPQEDILLEPCKNISPQKDILNESCQDRSPLEDLLLSEPCQDRSPIEHHLLPEPCQDRSSQEDILPEPCQDRNPQDDNLPEPCQIKGPHEDILPEPCQEEGSLKDILPEPCQVESPHAVCQGCQGKEHGIQILPLENTIHEMMPEQELDPPMIVIDQLDNVSTDQETSGSEESTYVEAMASSQDVEAARCLAMKLFHLEGFERSQVAPYLQKNNDFSAMVAEEYLALFDFTGKSLDVALRSLLKELVLTGETQERERVLFHFSKRFHTCNPKEFSSADSVHTLTCALMLLNSDLHGQNIGKSMTAQEFINNLEGMNDGGNFPRELLKSLYHSIRTDKLEWAVSEEKLPNVLIPRPESLLSVRKKSNPFVDIPSPDPQAPVYKQGMLCRKIHAASDGRKTPWGKRGWKSYHTVLKGMLLFSFKGEYRADFQFPEEVISIHHALAERASEYAKKPNVFRLQTADWRVFLFQAQTSEEMNSWISRINLVAATFSSPPFPSAVGSQRKFYRPILPSAASKLDLEEQLQSHETLMDRFTDDLTEHQRNLPDPKSKTRDWEDYHLREEYLRYEKLRYETYVKLLAVRMESSCEDLEVFESRLIQPEEVDGENGGLKRSYSSPSLKPENSPLVKVKRNISERRTYRRIIPKRNKNLV